MSRASNDTVQRAAFLKEHIEPCNSLDTLLSGFWKISDFSPVQSKGAIVSEEFAVS